MRLFAVREHLYYYHDIFGRFGKIDYGGLCGIQFFPTVVPVPYRTEQSEKYIDSKKSLYSFIFVTASIIMIK